MPASKSFRFATRPKWLAGHVLALVAVIGFINLGFWQLRRHDERAVTNASIEARISAGAIDWDSFVASVASDPEEREYRIVTVSGTYRASDEVLWQARTLNGNSGHDVLTPLAIEGSAVLVDRGWVSIRASGPPVVEASPPAGEVTITAMVREGSTRSGFGPTDPDSGRLDRISRVDIARLQPQIDVQLLPFYLVLIDQSPPQETDLPIVRGLPSTDAGPHLSYAVQWFVFAAIAAVGYPILLYRTSKEPPGKLRRVGVSTGSVEEEPPDGE